MQFLINLRGRDKYSGVTAILIDIMKEYSWGKLEGRVNLCVSHLLLANFCSPPRTRCVALPSFFFLSFEIFTIRAINGPECTEEQISEVLITDKPSLLRMQDFSKDYYSSINTKVRSDRKNRLENFRLDNPPSHNFHFTPVLATCLRNR